MFEEMERFYTQDFVWSIKATVLHQALAYVYEYRLWTQLPTIMTKVRQPRPMTLRGRGFEGSIG